MAPAGTPKEIVDRLNKELQAALADKEVQAKMLAAGTIAAYQSQQRIANRFLISSSRPSNAATD